MTFTQIYLLLSTILFVLLIIMLSTSSVAGQLLKGACAILAIMGMIALLGSLGVILAPGLKFV